jgi:urease subunit alpha
MINYALLGDPGAAVTQPQPVMHRPMYGTRGRALSHTCITFLPQAAIDQGVPERLELQRQVVAVENTRNVQKRNMVRNDRQPVIEVDPETFRVTVDGELAMIEPAQTVPLNQLYYLI